MKPTEYPLAEPYRLKLIEASETTKIEDYAKDMPLEKFKQEELRLMNGLYPKGEPKPGDFIKVVQ
jgi:predicted Zn-dependent protease